MKTLEKQKRRELAIKNSHNKDIHSYLEAMDEILNYRYSKRSSKQSMLTLKSDAVNIFRSSYKLGMKHGQDIAYEDSIYLINQEFEMKPIKIGGFAHDLREVKIAFKKLFKNLLFRRKLL